MGKLRLDVIVSKQIHFAVKEEIFHFVSASTFQTKIKLSTLMVFAGNHTWSNNSKIRIPSKCYTRNSSVKAAARLFKYFRKSEALPQLILVAQNHWMPKKEKH